MTIISLSGKKQSGKTTIAQLIKDIIVDINPFALINIISWADALKEEIAKACNVGVSYIEEHKSNFRLILQGWGTDFRRDLIDKDYWVKQGLNKINKLPNDSVVIIPDTRFLNELNALKYVGAYVIKIERNITTVDFHVSENELNDYKDWDLIIDNNSTIERLKQILIPEVRRIIK